mmetsp:Transcript_66798/g.157316  ORF Transcript_66798/g.157316 Transcript_66798/m.157316 type:complete len:326 (+) Transcript_66798:22-999(+)
MQQSDEFTALVRAGTISAAALCVITSPLDVARHAAQAVLSKKQPRPSVMEALKTAASPPSGLFRGLVPALCCSALGPAAFLLGYEVQRGSTEVLEAGLLAKAVQVVTVQPFDFFRTCRQATMLLPANTTMHLQRSAFEVITSDGPRSLWRGLIPTLLRDVPAAGIFWSCYMSVNQAMPPESWEEEFDPAAMRQRALQSAGIGAACAAGSAVVTQPMDVVKTKMQIHQMMTSRSDGYKKVKIARFLATFREVHQAAGWRGLLVGSSPRLVYATFSGLLLGPLCEYVQLLSNDSTRPLRSQRDFGQDPGSTIVHPRNTKDMFIDVKL